MKHSTRLALVFGGILAFAACNMDKSAAPSTSVTATTDPIDLVPDYSNTGASVMDGSGIGGSALPDSLKLTTEQVAAIKALKDAFETANKADLDALCAIEKEARAARNAKKARAEVMAILARAKPIRERLDAKFVALRAAINALYTAAQRAWIESHRPTECGRDGGPALSEAQLTAIRALKDAFEVANKTDIETVRTVVAEAKAARAAGKSQVDVKAILAKADAALDRLEKAAKKLNEDIMALLTPAQKAAWCVGRGMRGPDGPVPGDG